MNFNKPLLVLTAWLMLAMTSACNSQTAGTSVSEPPKSTEVVEPFRSHNLTLLGYNYTDFGIGSFEVNGQGGGGLEVSEGVNGGGGRVCCVSVYSPMSEALPITIKWNPIDDKWCEQTVMLVPPLPAKPENFEVHFYQDGHIEVAVSEGMGSDSRILLSAKHPNSRHQDENQNVDNSSKFARCRIGYQ
jgi:hypothetical protein